MKKQIAADSKNLAKFRNSELKSLSSITGGSESDPAKTSTINYDTVSSETDGDVNEHDRDA